MTARSRLDRAEAPHFGATREARLPGQDWPSVVRAVGVVGVNRGEAPGGAVEAPAVVADDHDLVALGPTSWPRGALSRFAGKLEHVEDGDRRKGGHTEEGVGGPCWGFEEPGEPPQPPSTV